MTVLRNNFNGGPDGTILTIANSGQDGDNAFQTVSTQGTGCIYQFADASALARATAEFCLHCSTGSTAHDEAVIWSTAMGTQTQIWFRFYVLFTATPSGALNPTIFECDNGAVFTGSLDVIPTTGKLRLTNGSGSVLDTSTNSLVPNEWSRIEGRFLYSTTIGSADVNWYMGDDVDGVTPTETISISGCNMGAANANSFAFGYAFSRANQPSAYWSGLELNNTGYPGPAPFRPGKGVPGVLTNPVAIHDATF